jgi:DNA-binding NarL/FixJ family response regulator
MIRVALADDHSGIRTAIRCLLEHSSDIVVVGEADNGKAALRMAQELSPDILVLDVDMPGMTGLEVIRQVNLLNLPVRVLVLSAYADYYRMSDLATTKVAKYIEKKDAHIFLVDGVHELANDKQPVFTH